MKNRRIAYGFVLLLLIAALLAGCGGQERKVEVDTGIFGPSGTPGTPTGGLNTALITSPQQITPAPTPVQTPQATPAQTNSFAALLPNAAASSSTTINGIAIALYADKTVSLDDGLGIIRPDGTVYLNGVRCEYIDTIEIPDGGTVTHTNGCAMAVVDGALYVAANGGMIVVEPDGDAFVYATP